LPDPTSGNGQASDVGQVDFYTSTGLLISRSTNPVFSAPWAMVIAPSNFGNLGGDLLVGNLNSGWIGAFDVHNGGQFLGFLQDPNGNLITINNLWALTFGDGVAGDPNALYFVAGPNNYADGLLGSIRFTPDSGAAATGAASTTSSSSTAILGH